MMTNNVMHWNFNSTDLQYFDLDLEKPEISCYIDISKQKDFVPVSKN